MIEPIEPFDHELTNSFRIASRHKLPFCIFDGHIRYGYGSYEPRLATDEEVILYKIVIGDAPIDLKSTEQEVINSFKYRKGPFTVNAADFSIMRLLVDRFTPNDKVSDLMAGFFGTYNNDAGYKCELYVSRRIPVGFFYEGEREPKLHNDFNDVSRNRSEKLDDITYHSIQSGLRPFSM